MTAILPDRSEPELEEKKQGFGGGIVKILGFALFLWAATWLGGYLTLRTEIKSAKSTALRRFPDAKASVRSPFPFVICYRINAKQSRAGVTATYCSESYYYWCVITRKIPEDDVKSFMKWIWF